MDFRLRVFLAVKKNLSFTKASKELFISQPAITKHIQELENTYMVQLFSRQGGCIKLTPQGELFSKYAQQIIGLYGELQNEMELSRVTLEGDYKIGISTHLSQSIASHLIEEFGKRFPQMHTTYVIDQADCIQNAVESGKIDMAILESGSSIEIILKEMDEKGEKISSFIHKWYNKSFQSNQ